jgi:hypothetical protein
MRRQILGDGMLFIGGHKRWKLTLPRVGRRPLHGGWRH